MNNPMDLTGKKYVVTGASSGLGRQICITLSELGASVMMIARNKERLSDTLSKMESSPSACHGIYALDLTKIDEIEPMVKKIVKENGKMDGLVHSAGLGTMSPLAMTTNSFMQEMMELNVFSFVELARVLTKKSNLLDGGSVLAISSISSKRGNKAKTAYAATKGALDSMVISMAIELGISRKIRVNTVNPGWIRTEMAENYFEAVGIERLKEIEAAQFLGMAESIDIANLVAFLLSDASKQITGQSIIIDGGNTAWMQ